MAPKQPSSPTLTLHITDEQYERAVQSQSGGCLIADAILSQYPHLSRVEVDMATIRATDRAKGVRYVYLTSPEAQHVLLSFDQGWPTPVHELVVRRAVKITKITRAKTGRDSIEHRRVTREEKRAALEQKLATGAPLTKPEKIALTRLTKPYEPVERPSSSGPVTAVETPPKAPATVIGGRAPVQGPPHPNLLRGRNRHFGAKLADPGQAFRDAVDAAVSERVAAETS